MNIPGIMFDKKDNKFKLYCGCCGSTNIMKEEVFRNPMGNHMYTIMCQKYCSPSGKKNVVCNIGDIKEIAIRCSKGDIDICYRMLNDVYEYLGLNKYTEYSMQSLDIEKYLINKLNIGIDEINGGGKDENRCFYYICLIGKGKYVIKVSAYDMKIYYIKAKDMSKLTIEDRIGYDKWMVYE